MVSTFLVFCLNERIWTLIVIIATGVTCLKNHFQKDNISMTRADSKEHYQKVSKS